MDFKTEDPISPFYKQLKSIGHVLTKQTILIITHVLVSVAAMTLMLTFITFRVALLPFVVILHASLMFWMFEFGKAGYQTCCYFPRLCCMTCIIGRKYLVVEESVSEKFSSPLKFVVNKQQVDPIEIKKRVTSDFVIGSHQHGATSSGKDAPTEEVSGTGGLLGSRQTATVDEKTISCEL